MPTKTGSCSKEKTVLVKVYVERPRKRKVSPNPHQHHHHHHHHHYLHQTIRREVIRYNGGASGEGYDRRAQLLRYSQHLRESARSTSKKSPLESSSSSGNHKPTSQTVAVLSNSKHPKTPGCLGCWKIFLPNINFRSLTRFEVKKERKKKKQSGSTSNKIKAIMKSLEMQKKKRGFISNCISALRKDR